MDLNDESQRNRLLVIVGIVVVVLLVGGIVAFVIVRRNAAGGSTAPGGTGATVNQSQQQGDANPPRPAKLDVVPSGDTTGPTRTSEAPAAPKEIPYVNRLLTDAEKAQYGYPKEAVVRIKTVVTDKGQETTALYVENAPSDKDNDGLTDNEEFAAGTDPNKPDTDGDTLGDRQEVKDYKTDPLKKDTDGDGVNDDVEIMKKTNPLDPKSF